MGNLDFYLYQNLLEKNNIAANIMEVKLCLEDLDYENCIVVKKS